MRWNRGAVTPRPILLIVVVLVIVGSMLPAGAWGRVERATPAPSSPVAATPTSGTPAVGTPVSATPVSATPIGATPVSATPAATPDVRATPVDAFDCAGPCLVRFASGPATDTALESTGMRASYRTETAVWVGGTPPDLGWLVAAGAEPVHIVDEAPSLNLYAITDGPARPNRELIEATGTVVDEEAATSIVALASVPAFVAELLAAGTVVEKVMPYVPAGTPQLTAQPGGSRPAVSDAVDQALDANESEIIWTIADLASSGVEPGTPGSRYFALPGNQIAAEYLFLRFAAYGLDVWYEDYVASNGMLSLNVVAEIPGKVEGPIWAAFAHFDTIAEDTPGNDIAPGALDNGTGVAVLLEAARVLSGYELTYPVRLVALNGEEVGLQGAFAFGDRAIEEGTPYGGGINIDSVGTAYGYRVLYVNASPSSAFIQDILLTVYDDVGFELNVAPRQNPAIVADEVPLTNAGIPTILVASMLYGDPLINCTCDTIDGVDTDYTRATARLVLLTLAVLARE
ncbi:MAG TPA: M28 family peptidase [Thermomicrobiales bacterium]|nr:M28 family peptidase [Thermomicrobiales bacterium]